MSFLGGPECSTAANPLAQFQKQTQSDTSLQRDRLASRQSHNVSGFRSQQPSHAEDAAFHEFAQQGPPQLGGQIPNEAFHLDQLRRETERLEKGGDGWAGEFAGGSHHFGGAAGLEEMKMGMNAEMPWSTREFARFNEGQNQAQTRFESPHAGAQAMAQQYRPMYGGGFGGMQRPMFQSQFYRPGGEERAFEGKGKGRIQELSDTDWERQFEELSSAEKLDEEGAEALDKEAEKAIEDELNGIDR